MNESQLTLADFVVLQRLTVGPVLVEPRRVKTRYTTTTRNGESKSMELIYTYDEPVFDPRKPQDINLACMVGAQVARNYGLFFEQITFDGLKPAILISRRAIASPGTCAPKKFGIRNSRQRDGSYGVKRKTVVGNHGCRAGRLGGEYQGP